MSKRRHIEVENPQGATLDSQNAAPVTRSDIWLEDGNIVLQAGNTQFKAHRGLLARVSPIFSDVFSVPQPAQNDDSVDGCPLLHLQDSAQDIQHLLHALYDHRYHTKEPIRFDAAAALLRVGRKYEIQVLFREILDRLKLDVPTTLEKYDKLPELSCWKEFVSEPGLLFKIAEFCQESGIPEVQACLPVLYYWCCYGNTDGMIKGFDSTDGVTTTRVEPLSPELFRVCLAGRQKLVNRFNDVFSWVDALGTFSACTNPEECSSISGALVRALWRPEPHLEYMLGTWFLLVQQLSRAEEYPVHLEELCSRCSLDAEQTYSWTRERTWDDLPSYFDLPGWDVLNSE